MFCTQDRGFQLCCKGYKKPLESFVQGRTWSDLFLKDHQLLLEIKWKEGLTEVEKPVRKPLQLSKQELMVGWMIISGR